MRINIASALLAATMAIAAGSSLAMAEDKMAPAAPMKDGMKPDSGMAAPMKDGMKPDEMKKDGMAPAAPMKDGMKPDEMKKDEMKKN